MGYPARQQYPVESAQPVLDQIDRRAQIESVVDAAHRAIEALSDFAMKIQLDPEKYLAEVIPSQHYPLKSGVIAEFYMEMHEIGHSPVTVRAPAPGLPRGVAISFLWGKQEG